MLVTAVVVPDAFNATRFADPAYHLNTEMFLRGIDSNGLILVDAEERLYNELCDKVDPLAGLGKGKNTHALFEELLKKRRQKVLRFVKTGCSVNNSRSTADVATQVVNHCRADALLVDSESQPALSTSAEAEIAVIPVPDYSSSRFEDERRRCCERLPPVDQMSVGRFDDLISRCTRYSRWLRLYDKQIGKGNSLSHFRRGIERILGLWTTAAYYPRSELHAEIFTVVDESAYASFSPDVAYRRVKNDIVDVLATTFGLRIDLHFKQDNRSICHARHLQTQCLAISFDSGFDFVEEDGTLRRNFIKIDGGCLEHLQEYRQLPEYRPSR
jgi:hypothetical protein